jgi:hypothetical protein
MATFPRTEPEIIVLAEEMIAGLAANPTIYPAPPVDTVALTHVRDTYLAARNDAVAARAAAEEATELKDTICGHLIESMKSDLRYAENTVNFDDAKLKLIGWSGRKARTQLEPPGQSRSLEAPRQGEGWVYLDWKAPTAGGKPSAYRVTRRERPAGPWTDVATAIETEITLVDQTRGVEFEYRIIAINKAGEGQPSNTVIVVL